MDPTMEPERIFSPEQIQVHPDLARVLREYSKSVIKENPDDLLEYSWRYFKKKVEDDKEKSKQIQNEKSNESEEPKNE